MDWSCIDPLDPVDLLVFSDVLESRGDLKGAAALRYLVRMRIWPYSEDGRWHYYFCDRHNRHCLGPTHWLFDGAVEHAPYKGGRPVIGVVCYDLVNPPRERADKPDRFSILLPDSPNQPLALLQWICANWRLPPEETF